jgi:hypothetical protein
MQIRLRATSSRSSQRAVRPSSFASRRMTSLVLSPGLRMAASRFTVGLQPNEAFALRVELRLVGHGAQRHRGGDGVEGGFDGDADHALTATFRYFVGFHSRAIRCASAI